MTLKVIGAGFGRTGTMSAYQALNRLGLPCYHMIEVLENKANREHIGFWYKVAQTPPGTQHDWEEVFSAYVAAVDFPASCVWRELLSAYPNAKVVLTLHPKGPGVWYESTIETIYFTELRWQFRVIEFVIPYWRKFGEVSRRLFWQRSLAGTMSDRQRAIARYEQHIEEVRAAVPADRLLVFSVDQGWEPLCRFLGVPIPAEPFPNVNERAQIKRQLARMTLGAHAITALAAAAFAGIVYAALRLT
jgi:Sulfotransferase domain